MGEDVPADQPVVARAGVLSVEIEDARVLYDPEKGRAHVLNHSAATIWGMLRSPTSRLDLVRGLVDGLGLTPEQATRDVDEVLRRLRAEELAGGPAAGADAPAGRAPVGAAPDAEPDLRSDAFALLDRRVAVTSSQQAVVDAVTWLTAPLRAVVDDRTTEEPELLRVEAAPGFERTLPARLNRKAAETTSCVVLHAAGVVRGGAAVAVVGRPGSGKSTLAAALVQQGWGYASDEAVGVRPSLDVVDYPKRLALELGSWPLFPRIAALGSAARAGFDPTRVRWVDPRDLRAGALEWRRATPAPALAVVVAPTYRAGAELRVHRLGPVDALVSLLAESFNVASVGSSALDTLRRVASDVPFFQIEHGGLDDVLPAFAELVAHAGLPAR